MPSTNIEWLLNENLWYCFGMKKGVWTGNIIRAVVGVGGAINTHHEGSLESRPTEVRANIDGYRPRHSKTPEDFRREREAKAAALRTANNLGERE